MPHEPLVHDVDALLRLGRKLKAVVEELADLEGLVTSVSEDEAGGSTAHNAISEYLKKTRDGHDRVLDRLKSLRDSLVPVADTFADQQSSMVTAFEDSLSKGAARSTEPW